MKKIKKLSALFIISLAFILLVSPLAFAENTPCVALDGVQIRLTETRGIRYIAEVSGNTDDYDEVGMLIIPSALLSGELTLETPDAGKISSLNDGFNYYSKGADSFRYTLCLIDITHEKFDREYVVRPYVKYTDGNTQKTVYGTNHEQYIGTPIGFTEKTLALYADNYGVLPTQEMETLDSIVTDYYKYLEENPEEELPAEPEEQEKILLSINEWYWSVGTLQSVDGAANETRSDRIYTPGYIPATEDTVITFDGASNVKYIVMEYTAKKEFICTSGWITTPSYTKRNNNAAYFRCVLMDGKSYTQADIAPLSSHLTITVPKTESYRYIGANEWTSGTLQSADGAVNTTRADRIVLSEFLPTNTVVSFDPTSGNSWLYMEYTEDYLKNTTHKSGTDFFSSSFAQNPTYSKVNENAAYCRFAMRNSKNSTISDVAAIAQSMTIKVPVDVYHSFFVAGDLSSDGKFVASENHAYTPYYIPADVKFTYDTGKKFTYKISLYDVNYNLIGTTESISAAENPEMNGASFYRIAVCPSFKVADDNIAYIGSAFDFKRTVGKDEWEPGTISASQNGQLADRVNRLRTPAYYPAANVNVRFTATSDVTHYYVMGYDINKKYIGTSTAYQHTEAVFSPSPDLDGAYYYRFAVATTAANPDTSVATDALDISYLILSPEKTEVAVDDSFQYVDDESCLEFRFPYYSIYNLSKGNYLSGICMVEDELWLFSTSDRAQDGSGYGVTLRYSMNFENKTAEYIGYFTHNFGHTNSINYNPKNKALTFGNGGADFLTENNYFYVYNNPYETIKSGASGLELSDAVAYSWSDCGLPYMTKLNTAWYGNSSLLVVANNNGYVYKIALGTGGRKLRFGNALEVSDGEFNGTWDIIKTYEMSDNRDNAQATGFRGQGYDQCNQGTHFADGTLYLNLGHDGAYIWKCKLYNDGSIAREEFHKYIKVGTTTISNAISGIEKYGDYLIFSNGDYIHVYSHDKLK